MRYRMALLDPPPGLLPTEVAVWAGSLRGVSGRFGALYYPWLEAPDPRSFDAPSITVPPSGHVAGIFARSDQLKGVRKPPANEPLDFLTDIAFAVDDDTQGDLNTARVNCIRALSGRGIRIWGARTLSAPADTTWMFINVRRLMSFIEASIERSSRWAVFENNDDRLRRAMVHSLNVFLRGIWESGGLNGNRPEEAYFVKCDATNNPPATVDNGQLICQVGVAVAVPMEFLIFEIRRNVDSAQVVEEEQTL
jgi:phage tail sheath protein FI